VIKPAAGSAPKAAAAAPTPSSSSSKPAASPFVAAAAKAASPLTGTKRARVPDDLEACSHGDLVQLVKQLRSERDALEAGATAAGKAASSLGGVQQLLPGSRQRLDGTTMPPASANFLVAQEAECMKKRLADKAVKAIRKTKHNDKRKPYTEVSEGVANKATAMRLLDGCPLKSDTARMTRWLLEGDSAIAGWLGIEKLVHPVAFDGKVWCFAGGPPPRIYAWAGLESLEVKWEPSSSLLTLKFRTFMAGSGDPESAPRLRAYARGEIAVRPDPNELPF
jgi:hypothetical protein